VLVSMQSMANQQHGMEAYEFAGRLAQMHRLGGAEEVCVHFEARDKKRAVLFQHCKVLIRPKLRRYRLSWVLNQYLVQRAVEWPPAASQMCLSKPACAVGRCCLGHVQHRRWPSLVLLHQAVLCNAGSVHVAEPARAHAQK
jgi:hypothetical protein